MRERRAWTATEDRQLIRWSKKFVPITEIAENLGRSYSQVVSRRIVLRKQGRLGASIKGYARNRTWTPDEDLRLRELIDDGYTVQRIAKLLKRPEHGIRVYASRNGLRLHRRRGAYSSIQAAAILGLGCAKTIALWIERGWLQPIYGRRSTTRRNYVSVESLWAFVENPETFMAWEPERITDPDLKAHALEHRAKHPRWLSVGEVARRYHVHHPAVNDWINRNLFPLDLIVKYRNWWIREDALTQFTPPCMRPSTRKPVRVRYLCCGREAPLELIFSVDGDERICDECRKNYRVHHLSNRAVFRVYPV